MHLTHLTHDKSSVSISILVATTKLLLIAAIYRIVILHQEWNYIELYKIIIIVTNISLLC